MHCRALPLRSLPHQPKLLLDFLYNYENVSRFYPHKPAVESTLAAVKSLDYPAERRAALVSILRAQSREFGASAATLANLERLAKGAAVVVTGQQVGLFSGPSYAIYKALAASRVAKDLTEAGIDAVPVFWMATEDHDLDEVRHVTFFAGGELRRFELPPGASAGCPVGTISLGSDAEGLVAAACRLLDINGGSPVAQALRETYRPSETYGGAFARLFTNILSEFGVILLDPLDPALHRLAAPVLAQAAERRDEFGTQLLKRSKELESAGYTAQVRVTDRSTLLFSLEGGVREAIAASDKGFRVGARNWTREDLLSRVKAEPEKFSPNALLRPVVQDFLLPSAVYLGGPAEVSYCAQSEVLYRGILGRSPALIPRADFTLVDPKAQRLMTQYGVTIEDIWSGSQNLGRKLQLSSLPKALLKQFTADTKQIDKILAKWKVGISKLDATLDPAFKTASRKIRYQADKLAQRTGRALDRKKGVLQSHDEFLSNLLYPRKSLQSRELNFLPFLARWGNQGLHDLEKHAGLRHLGQHFVVPVP